MTNYNKTIAYICKIFIYDSQEWLYDSQDWLYTLEYDEQHKKRNIMKLCINSSLHSLLEENILIIVWKDEPCNLCNMKNKQYIPQTLLS